MWQNRIIGYSDEAPDQLLANPRNFRTHPGSQADALRGVLGDVGIVQNVLANKRTGYLIDGHLRVMEALKSGQPTIPVTWVDVSEDEEALILATLDPIAALAGTDAAKLEDLLRDVSTTDVALQQMLDNLATEAGIVPGVEAGQGGDEFDTTPDDTGPTRTAVGDLWLIGGVHRLLVGDCTIAENVARLMDGERAGAVVTDPPYGTGIDPRSKLGNSKIEFYVPGDADTAIATTAFKTWSITADAQVWWGANYYAHALPPSCCWLVWDKDHHGMTFADGELAWCNLKRPVRMFRHAWSGADRDSERGEDRQHPNQKPVALFEWCYESVDAGSIIADPFMGSGGNLIAAHRTGRRCYGMEIEPRYADVILRRAEAEGLDCVRVE